ncbi:MAG: ferrous iron transporter B [Polyangiales bacterium]
MSDDAEPRVVVALVGRPNAGKSSLFNRVTGGGARVGNFPGVTVDVLSARMRHGSREVEVVDLPGLYSLTDGDDDTDEGITRAWLLRLAASGARAVVVQVLDATQVALGLRLTRELAALPLPVALALTQRDAAERAGVRVDVDGLSADLGLPAVSVSARDPAARGAVLDLALAAADLDERARPAPAWDPDAVAAHRASRAKRDGPTLTARLDAVLLHPVLGSVCFVALMAALFAAVFLVADPATSVLDAATRRLGALASRHLASPTARSFVVDGLLGGAGTVLAFLPQIVILTVAMELLDASGYLSRGVFLVDRALRAVGLSGRAFVPLLTAHACAVPAITATRILRDPRERLVALLVLPLTTCSARVPTYGLLIAAFFAGRSAWAKSLVFVGLYAAGVVCSLVAAAVLRRLVVKGKPLPLVIEMPAYRAPRAVDVARVASRAAGRFVKEVGTTIMVVSAVLWALLTVPVPGRVVPADATPSQRIEASVAAGVGRAIEPVTRAAGFDWRINVGLVGSFGAREVMVGTLGVIWGIEGADDDPAPLASRLREARGPDGAPLYGLPTALALMAFFVVACQCMSTVAALRRETRSWRWPVFVVAYTYTLGFGLAVLVYRIARIAVG